MEEKKNQPAQAIAHKIQNFPGMVKRCGIVVVFLLIIVGLIFILINALDFYMRAEEIGNNIGSVPGRIAGSAAGSYDGITRGVKEGSEAGRAYGLSAEDTSTDVSDMRKIGKLEVLVAEDQFVNDFREGSDYRALFVYKAQAVFSVDLNLAVIDRETSPVTIILPVPEVEFVIDENESEKLVEWQRFFWSGSAEVGYIGYMNSMSEIKKKAADEMTNYDYLMEEAKNSARKQVEILAASLYGREERPQVVFEGEGN